jgi:hypothetical protein
MRRPCLPCRCASGRPTRGVGDWPRHEDKIPPYHLVSLDGRAQACVQLRMQGTDTLRRPFLGPVDHVLSFVGTLLEGAQKAAGLRLFKRNLREQVSMAGGVPAPVSFLCVPIAHLTALGRHSSSSNGRAMIVRLLRQLSICLLRPLAPMPVLSMSSPSPSPRCRAHKTARYAPALLLLLLTRGALQCSICTVARSSVARSLEPADNQPRRQYCCLSWALLSFLYQLQLALF